MTKALNKRYTREEEILNSASHGVGAVLAVGGTVVLIIMSAMFSNTWSVVSSCIY